MDLKPIIEELIKTNDFVTLDQITALEGTKGEKSLWWIPPNLPAQCIWEGMNQRCIGAIKSLISDRKVELLRTTPKTYGDKLPKTCTCPCVLHYRV